MNHYSQVCKIWYRGGSETYLHTVYEIQFLSQQL
jgi:hypothetical protein